MAIVSTVDEAPFSNPRVLVLQVGNLCRTFFTKPEQYSRGLMFSLDHGLPELGHDSPGQILQATCYMYNNMMRDSPEIERRALIDFLSGKVPFPFSDAPIAKLEDLQVLHNLYDGMAAVKKIQFQTRRRLFITAGSCRNPDPKKIQTRLTGALPETFPKASPSPARSQEGGLPRRYPPPLPFRGGRGRRGVASHLDLRWVL